VVTTLTSTASNISSSTRKSIGDYSGSRENNFDALRFFLAVLVIFSHSFVLLGRDASEPAHRLWSGQIDLGIIAVDLFFAISGFLILASWENSRSVSSYIKKRCLRIYPGYIAALVVTVFVVGVLGADDRVAYLHQNDILASIYRPLLFRNVISVQHAFTHNVARGNLNGSLWTIRFELFCYAVVALLGVLGLHKRRWILVGLFAAVYIGYLLQKRPIQLPYFDYLDELPRLMMYFLVGMLAYRFRFQIPHSRLLALACAILPLIMLKHGLRLVLPLCAPYLVYFLAYEPSLKLHRFGAKGDFSYGIYLYGFPIQQLLIHFLPGKLQPLSLFAITLPCVFCTAYLSWHCIEKPFLRAKPRSGDAVATESKAPVASIV